MMREEGDTPLLGCMSFAELVGIQHIAFGCFRDARTIVIWPMPWVDVSVHILPWHPIICRGPVLVMSLINRNGTSNKLAVEYHCSDHHPHRVTIRVSADLRYGCSSGKQAVTLGGRLGCTSSRVIMLLSEISAIFLSPMQSTFYGGLVAENQKF
jgi:hypothetical protein